MSTLRSLKRFQRVKAKRGSLEEKTKIFEENARKAKLSIDKELLVQVLQEENRTHDETIKELEEKIADLEMQIKSSSEVESIPTETPSEPAQETTEPIQETPTEVDEHVSTDPFQDVRVLLQESKPIESEVPPEAPKKKRRSLF